MSYEYDKILRQYDIPPGVLSEEELRMLHQGGIRLQDSDGEDNNDYGRNTQPRIPRQGMNIQNQSLKQIFENKISMKDKQIDFLQAQLLRRDQLLQAQRNRIKAQSQIEKEKLLAELRHARAKVVHSEGQIPLIKEALNQVRQMLSGMVSQSIYLRLKDMPDKQLPPSQWLLVNVWELVYPYRKQLEYSKRQTAQLRDQVKQMNDKQNQLLNQLDYYSRLLSNKDDDLKRYTLNYENNRKNMELQIDQLRVQLQLNRQKGARYDELLRDYNFTKQEKELIEEKLGFYNNQMSKNNSVGANLSAQQRAKREAEVLKASNEYLTKENIQLIEKNRRLQDRIDRMEAELLRERNTSQQYRRQLMNLNKDAVGAYEQKIYRQISQLKEKHNHQLEMAKNNLVDIYEKQIRFLKDNLEEKQLKLENVDRQLRQRKKQYDQVIIDSKSFQRKFDGDLSEARINLKIKTQELDRINNIYQETLGNLKAHKIENQMLREKLNCLKGQYYKAQANNKDQMSSLKAQVAVLRQQLANYQLIQKQIDEAIISLGNLKPNQGGIFASTLHSVPTSSKRRIQQALGLAQRLQAKQRQHEQTLELLRRRQKQLQEAQNQLKVARTLLDKTNQPYSYLVSNLQQKQREIIALRNQNRKIDQSYQDIKAEYRELKRQLQEAEKDVQRLLVKRQAIQNIQSILIDLSKGPTTPGQIQSAVEDIRQILGATGPKKGNNFNNTSQQQDQKRINQAPNWYRKLVQKKG